LRDLKGHGNYVNAVAVTPDGRYAVSGSYDCTLKVWDIQTGNCLRDLKGHGNYVNAVAVTPDGRYAVSGSSDNTLKVWDLKRIVIENAHIIARNSAMPIHYYHRKETGGSWTPWKRIDADISGDHIMPVLHNSRLFLFWPTFEENHYTVPNETDPNKQDAKKYYSIKLSFIECRDGQWSGQSQSTGVIGDKDKTSFDSDRLDTDKFFFEMDQSFADDLRILVFRKNNNGISRLPYCFRFLDSRNDLIVESCDISGPVISGPENSEILDMGFKLQFNDPAGKGTLSIDLTNQNEDLLKSTNSNSIILMARQRYLECNSRDDGFSFFFQDGNQDSNRSFFADKKNYRYQFQTFYHPYVGELIKALQAHGIDGLLDPREKWFDARDLRRQQIEKEFFENSYLPTRNVLMPYPKDEIDFSYGGSYSNYNWELFFQTSFLIAKKLSQEQRFAEAQKWYHYIFDPTSVSSDPVPNRFWKVKPFYSAGLGTPLGIVMLNLGNKEPPEALKQVIEEMRMQIEGWRHDPSNPHRIARLRISAYQKAVVMKYLDNLIAWGDYLFRQDTLESINEAIQLYVLADQILGNRPESIPARKGRHEETFNEVRERLDEFSNFIANAESLACLMGAGDAPAAVPDSEPLHLGPSLFFCIPKNDNLLSYWDTVGDRLYKIRHCMNIEGVERSLALFEPPIDPGQLVRAAAAGAGAGAVPVTPVALPRYRFQIMLRKAMEFCSGVEGLGKAFLSALEKKDSEGLERLSANQVQPDVQLIKEKQVDEANEVIDELKHAQEIIETKINGFDSQIDPGSVVGWFARGFRLVSSVSSIAKSGKEMYDDRKRGNDSEKERSERSSNLEDQQKRFAATNSIKNGRDKAKASMALAQFSYSLESAFTSVPMIIVGGAGAASSPVSLTIMGGNQVKGKGVAAAKVFEMISQILNFAADIADQVEEGLRQKEELQNKKAQAESEKDKIDKQINAAKIRLDIAEKELKNQKLQEKNAQEIAAYMRSKFTNLELYDWMVSSLSNLYFQSYNLAFDMAKTAEKAYQFELGLSNANFVQYGQWDSLKKGLLSGESLKLQLMRMEAAYLENNKREYEITKHISLAAINPSALIKLVNEGECEVNLDEILFDLDYPGQYMRRIKAISLTIEGEAEPYSTVSCKLTMVKNSMRISSLEPSSYTREKGEDSRFLDDYACVQSIVTSSGKDDSGMFELDLKDERYLPFEGAGVISQWHIELPNHDFQVEANVIEDVIFNIRYTAREGGNELRDAARKKIKEKIDDFKELLMAKGQRQILLFDKPETDKKTYKSTVNSLKISGVKFSVAQVDLVIRLDGDTNTKAKFAFGNVNEDIEFAGTGGELRHSTIRFPNQPNEEKTCTIEFTDHDFDSSKVKYLAIMVKYKGSDQNQT
jgi:hypothetical protein